MKFEVKRIGNSDGLILPRELMQRLDIKRGQEFHVTELAGGGLQLIPYDPDFEATMEAADKSWTNTATRLRRWQNDRSVA